MNDDTKKIIEEYSSEYCTLLEETYGKGMMSEGGAEAINSMFSEDSLENKSMLDIGFGMGGVVFYLAENVSGVKVSGVEINPGMIENVKARIPRSLQDKIDLAHYLPQESLPFSDQHFDIVFSKGVLTHLNDKRNLFAEVFRVLKPGGVFVVVDWLSPTKDVWGDRLKHMCEVEGLTLYAETEQGYRQLLTDAGFVDIQMRDENADYNRYNLEIVEHLKQQKSAVNKHPIFNKYDLDEAIDCYQMVADSIRDNELLIRWFRCVKP